MSLFTLRMRSDATWGLIKSQRNKAKINIQYHNMGNYCFSKLPLKSYILIISQNNETQVGRLSCAEKEERMGL